MKNIKVGTRIRDSIGNILECVNIEGFMYEMKYVNADGLSKGSVFYVPSHFDRLQIVN